MAGYRWRGYPVASAPKVQQVRRGDRGRSAIGYSTSIPAPGPLQDGPAGATGYPLQAHLSCERNTHCRAVGVL
jgi:hypothetical protein